jgi:hypothetical protein
MRDEAPLLIGQMAPGKWDEEYPSLAFDLTPVCESNIIFNIRLNKAEAIFFGVQ